MSIRCVCFFPTGCHLVMNTIKLVWSGYFWLCWKESVSLWGWGLQASGRMTKSGRCAIYGWGHLLSTWASFEYQCPGSSSARVSGCKLSAKRNVHHWSSPFWETRMGHHTVPHTTSVTQIQRQGTFMLTPAQLGKKVQVEDAVMTDCLVTAQSAPVE